MYAAENPKEGKFVRAGTKPDIAMSTIQAAWERVLVGDGHREMMNTTMKMSDALRERLKTVNQTWKPVIIAGPAQKASDAHN